MKITNEENPFELTIKRFYFPAVIKGKCPKCGEDFVRNFEDDYLSYPKANQVFEEDMFHYVKGENEEDGYDCEFTVKLKLTLNLEIVK